MNITRTSWNEWKDQYDDARRQYEMSATISARYLSDGYTTADSETGEIRANMKFHYTDEHMAAWKEFIELHGENAGMTAAKFSTVNWYCPPAQQPSVDGSQETKTIVVAEGQPHPLEPKKELECGCGARACGHGRHSDYCDLYVPD